MDTDPGVSEHQKKKNRFMDCAERCQDDGKPRGLPQKKLVRTAIEKVL